MVFPNLLPRQGEVFLLPDLLAGQAPAYLQQLVTGIPWKQAPIKIFGREVMQPRLTAWYGEEGKAYTYSGITMQPLPWTETLRAIKSIVEQAAGVTFNSALLNLYRHGQDSMGWHRDHEKELGASPVIGSVSLGAERMFQLRPYAEKKPVVSVILPTGSFLLMRGDTQRYWEHRVPKTAKEVLPRVNITFRVVV